MYCRLSCEDPGTERHVKLQNKKTIKMDMLRNRYRKIELKKNTLVFYSSSGLSAVLTRRRGPRVGGFGFANGVLAALPFDSEWSC